MSEESKRLIGRVMFVVPFIVIFALSVMAGGWKIALGSFLAVGLFLGWIFLATILLDR